MSNDEFETPAPTSRVPRRIYALQTTYLVVLFACAVSYLDVASFRAIVPDPVGPVPLGVVWFGALGGVLISIEGSVKHRRDWDTTMHVWHYLRPLVGVALGVVSYLIFVVVIAATGTSPIRKGTLVYYLVAFVVAYREETFRSLIKRATDVLLANSPPPDRGKGRT